MRNGKRQSRFFGHRQQISVHLQNENKADDLRLWQMDLAQRLTLTIIDNDSEIKNKSV